MNINAERGTRNAEHYSWVRVPCVSTKLLSRPADWLRHATAVHHQKRSVPHRQVVLTRRSFRLLLPQRSPSWPETLSANVLVAPLGNLLRQKSPTGAAVAPRHQSAVSVAGFERNAQHRQQ